MKGFHQMTWKDRVRLDVLLRHGYTNKSELARILGVTRGTIYNELKRGQYLHRNIDYTEEVRYSPEIAQRNYEENLKARGTSLKIGSNIRFANYLEEKIVDEGYSPDAVLGELKVTGRDQDFGITICTRTLYSYIDKGIFLRLSNKELPVKGKRKRGYHPVVKVAKRKEAGVSIEKRPEGIGERKEFGHWEMDSVIGSRGHSRNTLLVLTERKTRAEIIFKQPDKSSEAVVRSLDRLERKWGTELFRQVFRTITVDNGSEFADCPGMERSISGEGRRTEIYYCHPFSSWERGSNENGNRMIRRHIPKGTVFDDKSEEEIQKIEDWMNRYPRRIHGYRSAGELFEEELEKLKPPGIA